MYRCAVCGSVVPPSTPSNRVTVETRPVEYPPRPKVHWHPPKDGGKGKWVDDPGGRGSQIARELRMCPRCVSTAGEHDAKHPPPPAK